MNENAIFKLRTLAKLSQSQLGKRLGVSQGRVCRWEQGVKPSLPHAKALAELFNVPVSTFNYALKDIENGGEPPGDVPTRWEMMLTNVPADVENQMYQACVTILIESLNAARKKA